MQNLFPFTILLGVTFTFYFGAAWLIPLAMAVDAYYGAFGTIPMLSIISICWYVMFELLRPHMHILK